MPLDGAALSSDDKGSEVWLRDGVLTRTSSFWSKMSYAELLLNACNPSFGEVLWEGDALAPRDLPAAARPADMHGFVKKVVGKVKSRVELAPSLALAMGEGGQLFGWCSFENPRRMCKGAPVVSDAQTCYCVFHRHCIDEWKGTGSSNCPMCKDSLLDPTSTPLVPNEHVGLSAELLGGGMHRLQPPTGLSPSPPIPPLPTPQQQAQAPAAAEAPPEWTPPEGCRSVRLDIDVPEGANVGDRLTYNTAAGQFSLVLPLGAAPGKKMMVTMPVPANFASNQPLTISELRINGNLPAPSEAALQFEAERKADSIAKELIEEEDAEKARAAGRSAASKAKAKAKKGKRGPAAPLPTEPPTEPQAAGSSAAHHAAGAAAACEDEPPGGKGKVKGKGKVSEISAEAKGDSSAVSAEPSAEPSADDCERARRLRAELAVVQARISGSTSERMKDAESLEQLELWAAEDAKEVGVNEEDAAKRKAEAEATEVAATLAIYRERPWLTKPADLDRRAATKEDVTDMLTAMVAVKAEFTKVGVIPNTIPTP